MHDAAATDDLQKPEESKSWPLETLLATDEQHPQVQDDKHEEEASTSQ